MTRKQAVSLYGKEVVKLAEKVFKEKFGENLFAREQKIWEQRNILKEAKKLLRSKKEFEEAMLELSAFY